MSIDQMNHMMENMKDLEQAVDSMRASLISLRKKMVRYNEILIDLKNDVAQQDNPEANAN